MTSIGLLKNNQTPWPPYRTPQQHHSAYSDPRKVLLSRLFHTVTWHCLYQSFVYNYVNEHTWSLVIHLLNQAWLYYISSTVNTKEFTSKLHQQPINIDPSGDFSQKDCNINTEDDDCPKKQIKKSLLTDSNQDWTLLFDRWFDDDDLVKNLCTIITIDDSETYSLSSITGEKYLV